MPVVLPITLASPLIINTYFISSHICILCTHYQFWEYFTKKRKFEIIFEKVLIIKPDRSTDFQSIFIKILLDYQDISLHNRPSLLYIEVKWLIHGDTV